METLVEKGYRGTTTTDVARRAGVSSGALLHHFPTKADLLAAAVDYVMQGRITEFRKAMADVPPDASRGDAAIDLLWSMFAGPTFTAWLELWVAARTDPELCDAVAHVDEAFAAASVEAFREVFADESAVNPDLPRFAVATVFTFLTGLATSSMLPGLQIVPNDEMLSLFKALVAPALPTAPEGTSA